MRSGRRKLLGPVLVGVLAALLLIPVAGLAAESRFVDVSDASPFVGDIEWLADAGVTRGCNPPENDRFCPKDYVTREQMAAFMHRQAGYFDGDGNGVVDDAEAVGGYYPWDLAAAYALYESGNWYDFESDPYVAVLELEIDPPGNGMVYLTGIVEYDAFDVSGHDLAAMLCTDLRCAREEYGPDVRGSGPVGAEAVTTAVLPVDGDGDVLRLWAKAENGAVDIIGRRITALYVPFGFTVDCNNGDCDVVEPAG
jgi:hypothetical protein